MLLVMANTRAQAADRGSCLAHVIILLACPTFPSALGANAVTTRGLRRGRLPVGVCESGGFGVSTLSLSSSS
jgi:hypothetical protein